MVSDSAGYGLSYDPALDVNSNKFTIVKLSIRHVKKNIVGTL